MTRAGWLCALACAVPTTASAEPDAVPTEPPVVTPVVVPVVAPVVPVVAPPVAKPKLPLDDLDLTSLDLDPARPDEKLNLYGFVDFSFRSVLDSGSNLSANYFPKESTFLVGNVDLYASKNLSPHWRSMLEVRFLYAPAGGVNPDGSFVHTAVPDPADLQRPVSYGSIAIERVYLEYEVNEFLTIQAGAFLTPYGIWNVDHGSPAIIPVNKPYIIGEGLFPEQQTGLHIYGKHPIGDYQLDYHATVSNGRGPFQAFRDLDNNKAIGGRLELETPWLDGVHFGLSTYRGRFTDRPTDQIATDASGNLINVTPPGTAYDEASYGADVLLNHGGLRLQAELIDNERKYLTGARDLATGGFASDGRYFGVYALAGYRFNRWWQIMPFVVFETDRQRPTALLGDKPFIVESTVGLNFRPDPSVVLKLQFTRGVIYSHLVDIAVDGLTAQAAWAF